MAGLTNKQKRFVEEYLLDLNATQACIRAGYSKRNADKIGPELIGKTRVAVAVHKAIAKRSARTEITQDRVLKELARLAFVDHRKFYDEADQLIPIQKLDDDTAASLAGFEHVTVRGEKKEDLEYIKKIKTCDKKGSLELLGRHLGIFEKDNHQKKQAITLITRQVIK